jgi:D-alanyl-D-alanine endopeptidase (penicillin-binding protein 7)
MFSTLTIFIPFISLVAILTICPINEDALAQDTKNLQIKSPSTLIIDLDSKQTIYERDADTPRPIASLSKMLSALVLQEQCQILSPENEGKLHEMSIENRQAAKGGDKSKLTTSWKFTYRDLMHAALLRSDNRALPALGEACGLDGDQIAELMNEKAKKLGLKQTSFKEPTGLSKENVSTAREFMSVLEEVSKNPELSEIMAKKDYTLTAYKDNKPPRQIKIKSTDRILSKNIARVLAGKTGYTDLARYCLAILLESPKIPRLGMVFLGAEGRFTRFADVERTLKWLSEEKKSSQQTRVPRISSVRSSKTQTL